MSSERHTRAKELVTTARTLSQEARRRFLDEACGGDVELRQEVESLLAPDERTSDPSDTARLASIGAAEAERFRAGEVFATRYRIVSRLGSGGMGEVYRAHDLLLDVPVALKFLRTVSPRQRERLLKEASLGRQVSHPAVCRVFDVGESEGEFFFAMEYVEGEDLASQLRRIGRLPPSKVLELGRELCGGLAEAHARGVLHRDLKPANIMVDAHGRARITDFGIAIHEAEGAGEERPKGTPAYMAPEQFLAGGEVTERTDLYALGLVLYELVTGRRVFEAETLTDLLAQHQSPAWKPPARWAPEIDPRLERGILQALNEDPSQRPASARALAATFGAPLSDAAVERPPEHRQLTVMFCDLVGSMQLSEQLDPEALREVVSAYQETAGQGVEEFAGHVAQYLGDGILVYFGYPQAQEDAAERAVRAALRIREALAELNARLEREHGVRLALRTGIHTGPVVVGEMGGGRHRETLALGDTANLAARLQGVAEPDSIVISAATLRLVSGLFRTEALGEQALKGVASPLAVHRVLQPSGVRSRLEVSANLTPLVGRKAEIEFLLDRWEQAREGTGQVVLLSGEPGIGKSRLMLALRERLAEVPHTWLECRCSSYTQGSALYPVLELHRQGLRFTDEDTSDEKLAKLERGLERAGFVLENLVPLLAAFHSLPLPGRYSAPNLTSEGQRRKTLEALAEWLLRMGRQQPLVLLVEDLHWVDPSTLELLSHILEQIPTAPVLAVFTYRSGFRPPWEERSHVMPLQLGRLTRKQTARMVARVAGGERIPDGWVEQIVRKTDGVPLFVEELTKTVLEAENFANAEQLPPEPGAALAIPATLLDSLMARLDRLGAAKGLAQLAATIGREFSHELLRAVWSRDEAALQEGLSRLVDAELLYQRGFPPEATYLFKHNLIQEEAYQSLLKATRREYHRRIAAALEERFPQIAASQPELVAHHYTEAGLEEPAIDWWRRAGRRAVERSAYEEAIHHFRKGLELLTRTEASPQRTEQELELTESLGTALLSTRGYAAPEVEKTFDRARELCQEVGSEIPLRVLYGIWGVHVTRGDREATGKLLPLFLRRAERSRDPLWLLTAHTVAGFRAFLQGEFGRAREECETALQWYPSPEFQAFVREYGYDTGMYTFVTLMFSLWQTGYPDRAMRVRDQMMSIAEKSANPYSLSIARTGSVSQSRDLGEVEATLRLAEAELAHSMEQRLYHWVGPATCSRGWALAQLGQVDEGIAQNRQGLALCQAVGLRSCYAYWLGGLIEAYLEAQDVEAGLAAVEEGLTLCRTLLDRFYEAELMRLKGEFQLLRGDAAEAETWFRRALELSRRQESKSYELRAAMSLARRLRDQGKQEAARSLLGGVYGGFTEGLETRNLREAKQLLAELS